MKKHFISILGTTDYQDTIYHFNNKEVKTKFIQEALIKILDLSN